MRKVLLTLCAAGLVFSTSTPALSAETVEAGKTVTFDYTLKVDGEVADTSEGQQPLEYVHGQGMIVPGLEEELAGMAVGEQKTVTVPAEEGYGQINPEAFIEFPKENLGAEIDPQVGMVLGVPLENGQAMPAVISEVKDETIVLNMNHPLAGKDLVFDIKIVSVK